MTSRNRLPSVLAALAIAAAACGSTHAATAPTTAATTTTIATGTTTTSATTGGNPENVAAVRAQTAWETALATFKASPITTSSEIGVALRTLEAHSRAAAMTLLQAQPRHQSRFGSLVVTISKANVRLGFDVLEIQDATITSAKAKTIGPTLRGLTLDYHEEVVLSRS